MANLARRQDLFVAPQRKKFGDAQRAPAGRHAGELDGLKILHFAALPGLSTGVLSQPD
jgi:hypothetical protein